MYHKITNVTYNNEICLNCMQRKILVHQYSFKRLGSCLLITLKGV